MKRKLEAFVTVAAVVMLIATVGVYLWLIVESREPPQVLMWLAVLSLLGAIGSTYRIEDIQELLALLPFGKK